MSLSDFLGKNFNIMIIDFLAENLDRDFNQTEISECTGISRETVHEILTELVFNKIVKITDNTYKIKKFRLSNNEIVGNLIRATFAHSFIMADEEDCEGYKKLYEAIRSNDKEPIDVYIP